MLVSYHISQNPINGEPTAPIIIKQVELSSNIKSDPKTTCSGFETVGGGPSTQWLELENISDKDIQIHGFTIHVDKNSNGTLLQSGPDLSNMIKIKSGQKCTYSFNCVHMADSDQKCIQDTKDVVLTFEYNYGGVPRADGDNLYSDGGIVYKASTTPLTDDANNVKTWQFVENKWVFGNMQMKTTSPLQQFKAGTSIDQIQCEAHLHIALKAKDSSPICVKQETKQKLIERGWAKSA